MSESSPSAAPIGLWHFLQPGPNLSAAHLHLLRSSLCNESPLLPTTMTTQLGSSLAVGQQQHQQQQKDLAQLPPISKLTVEHLLEPMQRLDARLDYYFSDLWSQSGDQRSSQLPFMSGGPWKLIYATIVYLYLIKWLLPKLMEKRRPFHLNLTIRAYNLLMVLSNLYSFYQGARILSLGTRCFGCEVINHADYSNEAIELLHYGWLFFLSRLVEWLDTLFFVLRKKQRQVTKLHVFHHSFVPLLCWIYLKYHPGYTVAFFPFVNSFVHSIMYIYYFLATFGPQLQSYLWWKKYLTSLQIAQFVLIVLQLSSIPLSSNEHCQYPRGFLAGGFAGAVLFLWLFYTYYVDTYRKQGSPGSSSSCSRLSAISGQQEREGASRSLSDSIENAISDSICAHRLDRKSD